MKIIYFLLCLFILVACKTEAEKKQEIEKTKKEQQKKLIINKLNKLEKENKKNWKKIYPEEKK